MTVLVLQHCLRKKDLRDARIKYSWFAFANLKHFTALASKSRTELNLQSVCFLDGLWVWFSNLDFSKNENRSLLESGFQNSVFGLFTALRRYLDFPRSGRRLTYLIRGIIQTAKPLSTTKCTILGLTYVRPQICPFINIKWPRTGPFWCKSELD